jgi:hypothetical protein
MNTRTLVSTGALATALLYILPGGFWFTLGGGIRWLWGCPFAIAQVHGDTPYTGFLDFFWPSFLKNALFASIPLVILTLFRMRWRSLRIDLIYIGLVLAFLGYYSIYCRQFAAAFFIQK